MKQSTKVIVGVGVAALVAAGVAALISGGRPKSPGLPVSKGYIILPGCAGIQITSESSAKAYAEAKGAAANVFSPADYIAWVTKAFADLELPANCGNQMPQESKMFGFALLTAYIAGAAKAGKISEADAQQLLTTI